MSVVRSPRRFVSEAVIDHKYPVVPLGKTRDSHDCHCECPTNAIIGSAPALRDVLTKIDRVGPTEAAVLIGGETGTGKELVAQAIHIRSRRAGRPLVVANLAAVPPELVGAELFGHEAGAFTGAVQRRIGRFEAASGGTLFLDEVGELSQGVQVLLLRALQEGTFERLGSSETRRADIRVISATNRDLRDAVSRGKDEKIHAQLVTLLAPGSARSRRGPRQLGQIHRPRQRGRRGARGVQIVD